MATSADRIIVRPTRYGLLYLAILGGMLAGSVNYNNNAGFVLVFLLGTLAGVSLGYSRDNLKGLVITGTAPPPVFAGQDVRITVLIDPGNRDRIALGLSLADSRDVVCSLAAQTPDAVILNLPTRHRGRMTLDSVRISATYPLGLFRVRVHRPVSLSCLVYPAPVPDPGLLRQGPAGTSADGDEFRDPGPEDFQGLSRYQPGHDIHRISWKAFAAGKGVFVTEFSGRSGKLRVLDYEALADTDRETRLSQLCGQVLLADSWQMPFSLKLPGAGPVSGSGPSHRDQCLRLLALFPGETDV